MMTIRKLFKNEQGATAIEYGLLAALIAVAAIGGMTALGSSLEANFSSIGTKLDDNQA